MTKLCARGKSAAKRKFAVYPSAYANAYASKICAGKIKDPSGKKRKDWGPKKANKGTIVNVANKLEKASKAHAAQAKALRGIKKASKGLSITAGAQSGLGRIQKSKIVLEETKKRNKKPGNESYTGSHIKSEVGGKKVSNKSYEDYYKGMV